MLEIKIPLRSETIPSHNLLLHLLQNEVLAHGKEKKLE